MMTLNITDYLYSINRLGDQATERYADFNQIPKCVGSQLSQASQVSCGPDRFTGIGFGDCLGTALSGDLSRKLD